MPSHRIERTTEDIRRELTAIFRELKDPRVSGAFLSIVRVEVTNDLSYCTVQVSAIEGIDRAKEAVKGLKSRVRCGDSEAVRLHPPRAGSPPQTAPCSRADFQRDGQH